MARKKTGRRKAVRRTAKTPKQKGRGPGRPRKEKAEDEVVEPDIDIDLGEDTDILGEDGDGSADDSSEYYKKAEICKQKRKMMSFWTKHGKRHLGRHRYIRNCEITVFREQDEEIIVRLHALAGNPTRTEKELIGQIELHPNVASWLSQALIRVSNDFTKKLQADVEGDYIAPISD